MRVVLFRTLALEVPYFSARYWLISTPSFGSVPGGFRKKGRQFTSVYERVSEDLKNKERGLMFWFRVTCGLDVGRRTKSYLQVPLPNETPEHIRKMNHKDEEKKKKIVKFRRRTFAKKSGF